MSIRYFVLLAALFPISLFADGSGWPDLSSIKHVSGRAATIQDVTDGAAAVVLQADGKAIGEPIDIPVPQYALYHDANSGTVIRVVVIQAERAMGIDVYGAIDIETRRMYVSIPADFELLGQTIDAQK